MCTVLSVLGTVFLARLAMRVAFRRHCGHRFGPLRHHRRRFRRGFGPIDLNDIGEDDMDRPRGDVGDRVDGILAALELNARQTAEASDVVASIRSAVGPSRYAYAEPVLVALRAVAREPFDAELADAALAPILRPASLREAVDALEHLHHILTDEQRAELARRTTRTRA